jgi:putative transposase
MMDMIFENRIGRRSIRLKGYDYRDGGMYFITICTKDKMHTLGEIRNNIMGLSDIGCAVQKCWDDIPEHFPYVELDTFIVMPNHVHGILYMADITERGCWGLACQTPTSVEPRFSKPISGSLGAIIGAFKSACTKQINQLYDRHESIWQRNYYEHIIRSENERLRIRRYIMNNPAQWNIHPDNMP